MKCSREAMTMQIICQYNKLYTYITGLSQAQCLFTRSQFINVTGRKFVELQL